MAREFHYFPRLPGEIRNEIWKQCIPTPGLHFFNAGMDYWEKFILYSVFSLEKLEFDQPSAYFATRNVSQACRESRGYIASVVKHDDWSYLCLPDYRNASAFHTVRDILYIGIDPSCSLSCFRPLIPDSPACPALGIAFPEINTTKKVALRWYYGEGSEGLTEWYSRDLLWAPTHFPELETVYILDFTIDLRNGYKPNPAAEVFYGNGCRGIEVLPSDTAWSGAGPAREALKYFQDNYVSPTDAARWRRGHQPLRRLTGDGARLLYGGNGPPPPPDVDYFAVFDSTWPRLTCKPHFWKRKASRRHITYKIMAFVRDANSE